MISCEKATQICDKNQYNEATFHQKIQLNFHLILCKICKTFVKQNSTLTELYKSCNDEVKCLSSEEKEDFKAAFEKMKNNS